MSSKCTIYIDEAGDLGIGRGTQWFVLTGILIDEDNEADARKKLKHIKDTLNIKSLHFRELRNFEQKCFVVKELLTCNFTYANILIDTSKITINPKKDNGIPAVLTYNFACKMLLERLSWWLNANQKTAKIVLSSRGTSRDGELIDYIKDKLINYQNNNIRSNVFTSVTAKTASEWDMLQLADVCATSMFYQFEPNRYGMITPCYSYSLIPHLYKYNGEYLSYGIKYYDISMRPDKEYFYSKMICKQK